MLPRYLCLVVVSAVTSNTADAARFGDKGVIAPRGSISLSLDRFSPPQGDAVSSVTGLAAPGIWIFIANRLAIGGAIMGTVVKVTDVEAVLGAGLQGGAGFNLAFGDSASLFINGVLGLSRAAKVTTVFVRLDAPFLIHNGNYFIGIGPFMQLDLLTRFEGQSTGRNLSIGVATELGGWLSRGDDDDGMLRDYDAHEPEPGLEPQPDGGDGPPPDDGGGGDDWDV